MLLTYVCTSCHLILNTDCAVPCTCDHCGQPLKLEKEAGDKPESGIQENASPK